MIISGWSLTLFRGKDQHRNQDVKAAVTRARYKFGGGAWSG